MRFKRGQEVVCVDVSPREYPCVGIKLNEIYTVNSYSDDHGGWVILEEVKSPYSWNGCYYSDRFRPVTDISELTEILESVPESV